MLRKRAFDVLRADVVAIGPGDTLAQATAKLFAGLAATPDMDAVVVTDDDGFVGVADAFDILAALAGCAVDDGLRLSLGASDFEAVFARECRACLERPAVDMLRAAAAEVPSVEPRDALALVVDAMREAGSRIAAVVDGGRFLGVVCARDVLAELARLAASAREE
ncbi:CBS domain-containing protein [Desulfolutivibrio sulfoxidireducens]|uniref:CBS domain-containing protein n=1 Tax=Desulfolutivibrio sulfoxidireducens TaxID=2773299 RepID=UPI00159E5067|nr:CBS domain-containing protein [Desulfolutivibrio sulfoxidireducens]QLA17208.1 CBS domain-containing protein [Desulfolutivibrio sulfoxidireducens]QLA20777.1 CBS domain-containing protein [Desulfolutivibrio sulfoxidireducens]